MRIVKMLVPAGAVLAAGLVLAGAVGEKVRPVNVDKTGVALHGYDAVSYFENGAPLKGKPDYAYVWMGATWRFASDADRQKFVADKARYAPQFGGYCAKAVSENHTADVDPLAFRVVEGKLYLNYDTSVQKLWEKDIPGRIANAEKYWPNLQLTQ